MTHENVKKFALLYGNSNRNLSGTTRVLDGTNHNVFVKIFLQAQMPDPKTYKQHFENKHSKLPLPEELKDI